MQKKKATRKVSNIEKLENAGVLSKQFLSAGEIRAIGKLTPAEVNAIIRLKDKLGHGFVKKHVHKHEDPHAFFF